MNVRRSSYFVAGSWLLLAALVSANTAGSRTLQFRLALGANAFARSGAEPRHQISTSNGSSNEITFTPSSFASALDKYDGAFTGWRAYTASTGEMLGVTLRTFDDMKSLTAYVNWHLRKGTRILDRKARLNSNGTRIGERILIVRNIMGPDNFNRTYTSLIWTDGTTFHQITGPSVSVQTVLAMEKWIGVK
jgi:hypothetical protein